jgi:hypothetical protein
MSAHHVAPTASTLRTAYNVCFIKRHRLAQWRVIPKQAVQDRTRSSGLPQQCCQVGCADAFDRDRRWRFGIPLQPLQEEPFRREQPIAQHLVSGSSQLVRFSLPRQSRTQRTVLACAVAQLHPLSRLRHHGLSTPPCDSREDSCAARPASPAMTGRVWLRREMCERLPVCPRTNTSIACSISRFDASC